MRVFAPRMDRSINLLAVTADRRSAEMPGLIQTGDGGRTYPKPDVIIANRRRRVKTPGDGKIRRSISPRFISADVGLDSIRISAAGPNCGVKKHYFWGNDVQPSAWPIFGICSSRREIDIFLAHAQRRPFQAAELNFSRKFWAFFRISSGGGSSMKSSSICCDNRPSQSARNEPISKRFPSKSRIPGNSRANTDRFNKTLPCCKIAR